MPLRSATAFHGARHLSLRVVEIGDTFGVRIEIKDGGGCFHDVTFFCQRRPEFHAETDHIEVELP